MNTQMIINSVDLDGSPSSGYPVQVSMSKYAESYEPVGQVKDCVTGYTNSMVTVITDDSGKAPIELLPFDISTFMETKDFDTIVNNEQVGDIGFEMPVNVDVAVTESTPSGDDSRYKLINLSSIFAVEEINSSGTDSGFSMFELPNNKRPYPLDMTCEDLDTGELYLFYNLHPDYEPGVNFTPSEMLKDRFLYDVGNNTIYMPDIKINNIKVRYQVRPFYIDSASPTILRVHNPTTNANIHPTQSIHDKLKKNILNNGLVEGGSSLESIEVSSTSEPGSSYRDQEGNTITGNVNLYIDTKVYLWLEYPNPDGVAPIKNIHEIYLNHPLRDIDENYVYIRG